MKLKYYIVAFATASLTACATQPAVKDILSDPIASLNIATSENKLSDSTRNSLGIKAPGTVKKKVVLNITMTDVADGITNKFDYTVSYFVLDNGLVRQMSQGTANGIPSLTAFGLSYYVMPLIEQSVWHTKLNADMALINKNIKSLRNDIASPKENTQYDFEFSFVPEVQVANLPNLKNSCKTETWIPADTFHSQLTGDAIILNCDQFGDNQQIFRRVKQLFIKDLGITINLESSTSFRKRVYQITNVRVG